MGWTSSAKRTAGGGSMAGGSVGRQAMVSVNRQVATSQPRLASRQRDARVSAGATLRLAGNAPRCEPWLTCIAERPGSIAPEVQLGMRSCGHVTVLVPFFVLFYLALHG